MAVERKEDIMKDVYLKTPRGTFHIHETFASEEEARKNGYEYYFTHENVDIYVNHFDKDRPYHCHFGAVYH